MKADRFKVEAGEIRAALKETGFYLVKDFFLSDPPECASILRSQGKDALGGRTVPAVFNRSDLASRTIDSEKLRMVAHAIFKAPFFTGHSDLHQNIRTAWHRDDGTNARDNNGYFGSNRVGFDEVLVVKFATYLERDRYSGLWVVPGSHLSAHPGQGKKFLRCSYPDAIIFDVRLKHRGNSRFSIAHLLKRKRTSIFFTIAEYGEISGTFSDNNWNRQSTQIGKSVERGNQFMDDLLNPARVA